MSEPDPVAIQAPPQTLTTLVNAIGELKRRSCRDLLNIGAILNIISDHELFKERYDTWEEFLGSPEISIGRATAFKAMAISRFILAHGIDICRVEIIDPDKIYRILRVATDPETIDEWLHKAGELSRADLAAEVREIRGLPEHDVAKRSIEYVREFLYEYCPKKKIVPADRELEDLLLIYDKWRRVNFK